MGEYHSRTIKMCFPPLPLSTIPQSFWRGRERVGVRVDIFADGFPLTCILSPRGAEKRIYFLKNHES
jgi:hypothetical protein